MGAYVYIVKRRDGSYDTGTTRNSPDLRLAQHNDGTFGGYTANRRPVTRVYADYFDRIADAAAAERQIKGWSRAKNEALIENDFDALQNLFRRKKGIEG